MKPELINKLKLFQQATTSCSPGIRAADGELCSIFHSSYSKHKEPNPGGKCELFSVDEICSHLLVQNESVRRTKQHPLPTHPEGKKLQSHTYLWTKPSHGDPFLFCESGLVGSVVLFPRPLMLSQFTPEEQQEGEKSKECKTTKGTGTR